VVGVSLSNCSTDQTCHYPSFHSTTSLGCATFVGYRNSLSNFVESKYEEINLMADKSEKSETVNQNEYLPHRVNLPGFISDEEIGLGDAIKRATSYFGVKPCGGCAQRAAVLNRWMVFTNGHKK
jgi:hypothetical protein